MSFMPPTDSMFLLAESREHPMHVGGLQLFELPEDAGPDFVRELMETFRGTDNISPTFRKRPAEPVSSLGNTWWTLDDTIDYDHHIRHSAVPQPGRIRELLQLTSRWHGSLLDRHRPLWEAHVVEGLEDGRIAVYSKIHHALVDGVAAIRLMKRSLSEDPDARDCVPPWALPPRKSSGDGGGFDPMGFLRRPRQAPPARRPGCCRRPPKIVSQILRDGDITLPSAPRTILNGRVGGARRFAAQSWEIERIRRVAKSSATTSNDVVLAMVSGALREYLLEQHALPDEPMSAMVPVSLALRAESAGKEAGDSNSVGAIIVNLATDRENGATRLEEIAYSSRTTKKLLGDLSQNQILAFSALQMLPLAMSPLPGLHQVRPAAVQRHRLQRPGAEEPDVLQRRTARRHVPGVDRARRAGHQHHAVQPRQLPRLRHHRLPQERSPLAAAARPPGDVTRRARDCLGLTRSG